MEDRELFLENLFRGIGISLEKRQACQFLKYYDLLVSWNEKINLTAITDFNEVCVKHFIDSLSLINMFSSFEEMQDELSGKSIVDVGTGAGFPGIPLKIVFPNLKVTLIDSLDKRIHFLDEVISELDLSDISTVHGRVEDLAQVESYREQFDFATARAVAALPVLSEYCIPFVKCGGTFIAYKSEKAEEEISDSANALKVLGGSLEKSKTFLLSGTEYSRTILFIRKVSDTPNQYPRKAGKPSKKPL